MNSEKEKRQQVLTGLTEILKEIRKNAEEARIKNDPHYAKMRRIRKQKRKAARRARRIERLNRKR